MSSSKRKFECQAKYQFFDYGRIHLVHLWIHKYFTDDSSVNFHDKFFLHFLLKFRKKWRKNLSWKFTDESSIKYLWIRKWTRWIRPKYIQIGLWINQLLEYENYFRAIFFWPNWIKITKTNTYLLSYHRLFY